MLDIIRAIQAGSTGEIAVHGLRGGSAAFFLARVMEATGRPVVAVASSDLAASILEQDLPLFTPRPVHSFPSYDIPPYTPLSPEPQTVATRLATLYHLVNSPGPYVAVAPAEALLRRTLPRAPLADLCELILAGEDIDPKVLAAKLAQAGYEHLAMVRNVGEFSVRGGIVDIFSPGYDYPVRLDFFGDTVESLRLFDPVTQRSVQTIEEFIVLPAGEVLPPQDETGRDALIERFMDEGKKHGWHSRETATLCEHVAAGRGFPGVEFFLPLYHRQTAAFLDYVPREAIIVVLDPAAVSDALNTSRERIEANFSEAVHGRLPALPPADLFLSADAITNHLARFPRVGLYALPVETSAAQSFTVASSSHLLLKQEIELQRKTAGLLAHLAHTIAVWAGEGDGVLMACPSERRAAHMAELLKNHGLAAEILAPPVTFPLPGPGRVHVCGAPLSEGFDLPGEKLHLLSESELYGERRLKRVKKKTAAPAAPAVCFEELKTGDFVVHTTHGIGVYEGLVNLTLRGVANDYLQLSYQGNDRLYLPVDRMRSLTKYKGLTDAEPKVDRLGGKSWENAKRKVKEAVWKIAQDLLDLYARRQLAEGHAFSQPDDFYRDLEESFAYDETAGQLKAINDVLGDLTTGRPMDRLVCGDVGYGKTEVAVRGAFKVIADGFQAAVLVPTTVLAEQHAATFRERFEGFPVRVECLNRFRTPAEQKKIAQGISDGSIDLVVGTHRLLSKDISFRKLGLLIVDEEHRFGVVHKEKLKRLKAKVDVLTLTATPIPRTLQMSLLGIRDLSVISTPPQHRRAVKTYIAKYDDIIVKEAVTRELSRRGQVFLVHNRVQSIHDVAHKVQKLVPAARVAVAHGQMPGKLLEEIMVRFVRREIDVLVCTTIIESGLDIPNANTIIMTRADRLGLAEIYQLRGRVGRSREQAYAYLLMPTLDGLSNDAQKRLRALMDYNELGGGFKLAMSDLQIRGGGNLLGESQSGHITAVGYDLYLELLQQTVEDLKHRGGAEEAPPEMEEIEPEINLTLSAFLPESYVNDPDQRYFAYRKLTGVNTIEELEDMERELEDRYGRLPREAKNLLSVMDLKLVLRRFRVTKLEQGPAGLVFSFHETTPVSAEKILAFVQNRKNRATLKPDSRLVAALAPGGAGDLFDAAKKILHALL